MERSITVYVGETSLHRPSQLPPNLASRYCVFCPAHLLPHVLRFFVPKFVPVHVRSINLLSVHQTCHKPTSSELRLASSNWFKSWVIYKLTQVSCTILCYYTILLKTSVDVKSRGATTCNTNMGIGSQGPTGFIRPHARPCSAHHPCACCALSSRRPSPQCPLW